MRVRRSQHRLNKPFAGNSTVRRRAPDGARFFCAVLTSSQQFLITFALEAGLHMSMAIPDFSQLQVIVVGDLMLDEYIWGAVDRISPEAPVQIVEVKCKELRLGGAGNVINNLLTLNCQVDVVSVVGDDDDGQFLLRRLAERGVHQHGVFSQVGRVTSRKTRVLASNQQIVRIDQETRAEISAESEERILAYLQDSVSSLDVIYLSDYQKGVMTDRLLKEVIAIGRKANVPVLVDPKGEDYSKYIGATLLTPNRKEAQRATGISITDETTLVLG